jgi:thermitase
MNRNNIWIHIGLAVVIITMAAVLGQVGRWRSQLHQGRIESKTVTKTYDLETSKKTNTTAGNPEVLVKFKPGVTLADIKRIVAGNHDVLEDEIESVKGLVAIDDLDNADAETVAKQYGDLSDMVVYAEPNFKIELNDPVQKPGRSELTIDENDELPNDPQFAEQWALNNLGQNGGKAKADISAVKAWVKTHGSTDVVVAVLDSGVDYTHTDLATNMWQRPDTLASYTDDELGTFNDEHGFNATDNTADPMDENGHGTHCAGVIGAEGDNDEGIAGINWNVEIMPLKFMGRGGFGTTKDAIEAINYTIDRKKNGVNVRVINASWGSTSKSKALEDAIRAAGEQGILFVAAAGNNGTNNDRSPHYPSNYDLPNVISVAALDNTDALTSFSNFGVKTVHIAAPGKDILSTWLGNDYREASGTSMAAPQIAGVAALILASEPDLTVQELRARILRSVDKLPGLNGKVESGGRINAAKALGD